MTNIKKDENNRLYFIIRSWVMGQIGAIFFLATVWVLGSINFIQTVILGTFVFIVSLALSRLFDSNVEKVVKKTLNFLDKHNKIKKFILKYF